MLIHSPHDLALLVISQRKQLKLSQSEVAERVGLKQKTISAFENKPESTTVNTLFLILSAVNVDLTVVTKNKMVSNEPQWKEEW